jgi:hypothetical protein
MECQYESREDKKLALIRELPGNAEQLVKPFAILSYQKVLCTCNPRNFY